MSNKTEVNNNNGNYRVVELQNKLDCLYLERAQGAFYKITSQMDSDSAYFSNLEKSRQQRNSIDSLMIQGEGCKEYKIIEKEVMFYSKLYSSTFSPKESFLC